MVIAFGCASCDRAITTVTVPSALGTAVPWLTEIHEIELVPPVVIAGLPRTGTTHLHNLLAAGPTFRTLPYWESMEPLRMPAEIGVEPDPRRARSDLAVDFMNAAMPHFARMHRAPVPAAEMGRYWGDRIDRMLTSLIADRDAIPAERSIDVRFDEFMADDLAIAERIYELAGELVTPEAGAAMADYLAGHERGRLGTIDYRAGDLGLDADELRERFAPYVARFLL